MSVATLKLDRPASNLEPTNRAALPQAERASPAHDDADTRNITLQYAALPQRVPTLKLRST